MGVGVFVVFTIRSGVPVTVTWTVFVTVVAVSRESARDDFRCFVPDFVKLIVATIVPSDPDWMAVGFVDVQVNFVVAVASLHVQSAGAGSEWNFNPDGDRATVRTGWW
jgi:hypothetical protein